MVNRFLQTRALVVRQRHSLWLRLLSVVLILVLSSLLAHLFLEAAGATPGNIEQSILHSSVLSLVVSLLTTAFVQTVPLTLPRFTPSLWVPPLPPRPPLAFC